MAKQAHDCIANLLDIDADAVKEKRYEPLKYPQPVYLLRNFRVRLENGLSVELDFFMSPSKGKKQVEGFDWIYVGSAFGRDIYGAK
jgi:hypothetical protein